MKVIRMILKLYSMLIILLDFCYLVGRGIIIWAVCIYKTFFPDKPKSIEAENILITGAGNGIGKELALQLSQLGATIVCWDINKDAVRQTAEEIKALGGTAYHFQCDVSSYEDVRKTALDVRKTVGRVYAVFNNAGIMPCHPFLAHSVEEINRCIDVNLKGCLWVLREFLPGMIEERKGHIVSMSSIAGALGVDNVVPYSASKFAVRGMMEALAEELRHDPRNLNIHLTTVCPFVVDTGLCKKPRVRFPVFMGITETKEAVSTIVRGFCRNDSIIFIPEHIYLLWIATRIIPPKVKQLALDFFDTGVEPHDE